MAQEIFIGVEHLQLCYFPVPFAILVNKVLVLVERACIEEVVLWVIHSKYLAVAGLLALNQFALRA